MPRYVFILGLIDASARLDDDALVAAVMRLGALGKRENGAWVGDCEAANEIEARRHVESKLASLPRYVPKFKLVDLTAAN